MRPTNVLILIDKLFYHGSSRNGPAQYFGWLMQRLDRTRVEPHLVSLRGQKGEIDHLGGMGVDVTYLNARKGNPLVVMTILRLIRDRRIDLLHLTGYGACALGRIAAAMSRRSCLVQEHWVDPDLSWPMSLTERALGPLTTRAVAISDYAGDYLVRRKGIRRDKIVQVPNGVPLERYRDVDARAGVALRRELGIDEKAPTVGVIGMLHRNKGHRYFVEAADIVRRGRPDARFVIVGEGEERVALEAQVDRLGLGAHVVFAGERSDIPAVLSMLDVYVLCSNSETASLSVLEAMAAGKPIVMTDCGGPVEWLRNGHSGLVVPIRDPGALAAGVDSVIADHALARRLAAGARERSQHYGFDRVVMQMEDLYASMCRESSRGHVNGRP